MAIKDFIDLHTHGIGRYDTRTSNPDDILKMAKLFLKVKTTAFLPTIYSGTIKQMRANTEAVNEAIKIQNIEHRIQTKDKRQKTTGQKRSSPLIAHGSRILGVHLEGPFLNPLKAGAQDRETFLKPTLSNLERLIEGYEDIIKVITIAPELPGAIRVIEKCVEMGIRVNMGHSDATYREAEKAKNAGASGITHIFNAMRPIHHRELGLAGFGLIDDDIYIEVIPDGIHLDINMLKLILRIKTPERVIFVSDSVRWAVFRKGNKLIGSPVSLSDSFKNLKKSGSFVKGMERFVYENPMRYLHSLE